MSVVQFRPWAPSFTVHHFTSVIRANSLQTLTFQEECLRKILGGVEVQNRVAAFSVALENLLAEFHSRLRVRAPGRGAQAEGGFAIEAQKKCQWQFPGARQFQARPILGDFANLADKVLTERGM